MPVPPSIHALRTDMPVRRAVVACALLLSWGSARADTVDARCDIYPKGSDTASKVIACTFSQRQGHVAIDRADGIRHELSPRGAAGRYVDQDHRPAIRTQGLGKAGQIYRLEYETVYVYWDRAGLPGHPGVQPSRGTPAVLPAPASPPTPFDQSFKLLGIGFRVTSANSESINELRIVPSGLRIDNTPIVRSIEGRIIGAEVADLNADGSPEIYVYVAATGAGSRGSLVAYSANNRRSLSEIALPPIADSAEAAGGYRGHDEFAVVESTLVRRFPVYRDGDSDTAPSSGMRQLQHKLRAGEAGWVLKLDRIVNF
jgi:hypothetical protein